MMLLSLLSGIALAYKKLCDEICQAAEQLVGQKAEIDFRLVESQQQWTADSGSSTAHHNLSTNGTEPAQANPEHKGLAITLTGTMWRDLVLATIHREIFSSDSSELIVSQPPTLDPDLDSVPARTNTTTPTAPARLTLEGVIATMEARQKHRHAKMTPDVGEQARKRCEEDDFACLKMLGYVRSIVDGLEDSRRSFLAK